MRRYSNFFWLAALRAFFQVGLFATLVAAGPAVAQDFTGFSDSRDNGALFGIFDEVRVGALGDTKDDQDSGVIVSGQLYFRSFIPESNNYVVNTVLRPRIHVGGNLATAKDGVDQVYAGLTWHFPLPFNTFAEFSFGGTWHDGPFDSSANPNGGLSLGCPVLFREAYAAGVNVGRHWRVMAEFDHSSHNDYCYGGNSGLSHAGVYVGRRF